MTERDKNDKNRVRAFLEALRRQVPGGKTCEIAVSHLTLNGQPCNGKWTISFGSWDEAIRAMRDPITPNIGGGCKTCGQSGFIDQNAELVNFK